MVARMKRKPEGQLRYYPKSDVLHYVVRCGEEFATREAAPGVTLELDQRGRLIGIEILDASRFMRKFVIQQLQPLVEKAAK